MPAVATYLTHVLSSPDLYGAVYACRGDPFSVRRPRDSVYSTGMPTIGVNFTPGYSIPDLDCPIVACRCDVAAIVSRCMPLVRWPDHSVYQCSMPAIDCERGLLQWKGIHLLQWGKRFSVRGDSLFTEMYRGV